MVKFLKKNSNGKRLYLQLFSFLIFIIGFNTAVAAQTEKPATNQTNTSATKRKQRTPKYIVPYSDSLSAAERYAEFMQIDNNSILLPQLYDEIDEWIGTPYRYGRDSKQKGTDCSGFVGKVFQQLFEEKLPRSAAGMAGVVVNKPKDELQEGDLIILNYYGRRNSHVGIYLQNGWFVHASNVYGVTLANINNPYYKQKVNKCGSIKDFDINAFIPVEEKREEVKIDKLPLIDLPVSADVFKNDLIAYL